MSIRAIAAAAALSLGLAGAALAQTSPQAGQQQPTCQCPMQQGAGKAGTPMMRGMGGCGQMGQLANVTVENTSDGAILRFDAKDPSQVDAVRGMAQRMSSCANAAAPTPAAPTR